MPTFKDRYQLPNKVNTLLVAPHPDDIAYSVGGSLLADFFERPILIVTVFTMSMTALYYHGSRNVSLITELRSEEDEVFAYRTRSHLLRLGLEDATLSAKKGHGFSPLLNFSSVLAGYPSNKRQYHAISREIRSRMPLVASTKFLQSLSKFDRSYNLVKTTLSSILSETGIKTLVSPLALGNHPNHIVISQVCKELRNTVSHTYFYEDLPYANFLRPHQIRKHVILFHKQLRPVTIDIESVLNRKIENLEVYKTQVRSETEQVLKYAMRKDLGKGAHERLWTDSKETILEKEKFGMELLVNPTE